MKSVSEPPQASRFRLEFGFRELARFREADDSRDVQRARPKAVLMPAAVENRLKPDAGVLAPNVQRPHSFGPVNLMGCDGYEVGVKFFHVERHLSDALNGVAVEEDSALPAEDRDPRIG